MKNLTTAVLALALTAGAVSVQAQQTEISANVNLINDYKFRGISQTDRNRAVQGGFDYNHESGAYAGVWASTIEFADNIEMNYYAGFTGSLTNTVGYDVGVLVFEYPGLSALDTVEVYGALDYAGFTGKVSYTDSYFGTRGHAYYWELGHSAELAQNLTLDLHVGLTDAQRDLFGNKNDYLDYGLTLGTAVFGLDFSLGWIATNLSRGNCGSNACGSRAIVSVGKSF
ncbi:MAG: TorF family putative porin [Pseudohongiella sp.]|nr:TorF family putative porin [Pseudohongiella sp.]MDO9519002.1 TorF family putative porin [Pseudohongiella sp.]MDP2128894.1 TorF family putative porin [Pseudohongiella sp.]